MLSFAATPWGTLALTAGPDEAEPQAQILEQFTIRELRRVLGPDQTDILRSVPDLSAGLIHGLLPRLRTITQGADILYIIPDSYLYCAPFAALTLDPSPTSRALIDLSALAITPSAAILLWSDSRPRVAVGRACLAAAVGESTDHFKFHNHLRQIAGAPWPAGQRPTELQDAAATAAEIERQAPQYPVLYFSCHGKFDPGLGDLMAASELELAGGALLSAREVATWKLSADLVFLNACESGLFQLQARSEPNGFIRAFPMAGARSLIAPLIKVDPKAAGDMAESFFRAWLGGESKAGALRSAQIVARQKDPNCKDWATYCLIGDFQ
jgi:CHAT domain-containing protein